MTAAAPELARPLTETTMPVIAVAGLDHFFGQGDTRTQVLFGVDLEVEPGKIVIMMGASGCGKTTLLTLVGGLRTVQSGSVRVMGRELRGLGPTEMVEVRRDIGFIFQRHNLFSSLTARQNVLMALDLNPDLTPQQRNDRAVELLTDLDLGHRIDYLPSGLSGGQQQRVAIARALANRPKLVLADEPTAALDEESTNKVMRLFGQLVAEGSTFLVVTHDDRIIEEADSVVHMKKGKVLAVEPIKEWEWVIKFLLRSEEFRGLNPDEMKAVARRMNRERYAAGGVVVRQGDVGDKFYLIRRGHVSVTKDGSEVAILKEGEFFGERSLLTEQPRNATVTAVDELVVYSLDKADFQAALRDVPPFGERVRHYLMAR